MSTPARRPHLPSSPFQPRAETPIEVFEVGERVTHDTYGLGRVVAVDTAWVTVDFEGRGIRVPSPFRKLRKL